MYKNLIERLTQNLELFEKDDIPKIKDAIQYFENNQKFPLLIIKKGNYQKYKIYCEQHNYSLLSEWQYELCKTELNWE